MNGDDVLIDELLEFTPLSKKRVKLRIKSRQWLKADFLVDEGEDMVYVLQISFEDTDEGDDTAYWDYELDMMLVNRIIGVFDTEEAARQALGVARKWYEIKLAWTTEFPRNFLGTGVYKSLWPEQEK